LLESIDNFLELRKTITAKICGDLCQKMNRDEFGFLRTLTAVVAVIAFMQGYMNASAVSPFWSGIGAAILSPFMVIVPSIFAAVILSAIFGGKGLQLITWGFALFLVFFFDLAMKSGGGCDGYEVEDRWGVIRCYKR